MGLGNSTKCTRNRTFLADKERVVPWAPIVELVAPFGPERAAWTAFSMETMLRIHFMQPVGGGQEHKLVPQILATVNALLSDQGLLLRAGTVVDATLTAAPSSAKNQSGERDLEIHQSKKVGCRPCTPVSRAVTQ